MTFQNRVSGAYASIRWTLSQIANMADGARGPAVGRPLEFANEEQRAVHSWCRIESAGHSVLLEAVKILSPMSRDLSSTQELVTFLQELSEEGHKPTVLRSKDVYGYRSSINKPLTVDMLKPPSRNVRPIAKKRRRVRVKKREVHPSWNVFQRGNPRIQGVPPPEQLTDHQTVVCNKTPVRTLEMSEAPPVQSCLRLTNIKGLSGCHTARLQIQTTWDLPRKTPPAVFLQKQPPPALSGIPSQPSQNGGGASTRAVALFSQKSLSCPLRLDGALVGDSAPVFYANGRGFPQTHTEHTSNGWGGNVLRQNGQGPKELPHPTRQRNRWRDKTLLGSKIVKVDDSRSVDEARCKAQKILQVNLSPVIQICPLNHALRDFRYQNSN
ncbi:coiled-coil domain-containing protein 71 isoform X1 [Hippocampus comes]|nr:PREDICTED: coiled-coil domain-containing protein 71 isoform X1 [Hippocampus comes]XP_019716050.1 PREDICTED: coiled-coil domain-containing protein 71 isoform X1 [Hippocampus comes]